MPELSEEERSRIYEEELRKREAARPSELEIFAVLSCASGLMSLALLPIAFGPLALLLAVASDVRMKNQPHLRGSGPKIAGLLLGLLSTGVAAYGLYQANQILQGLQSLGGG